MIKGFISKKNIKIKRTRIYYLVLILLFIQLIHPKALPMARSSCSLCYVDKLKKLEEGDVVLVDLASSLNESPKNLPYIVDATKFLLQNKVKIIFLSTSFDNYVVFKEIVRTVPEFSELQYGVDYIYLGKLVGGESGIAQMASSIKHSFWTDYNGTDIEQFPIMNNMGPPTWPNISMIICSDIGDTYIYFIRQWYEPHGVFVLDVKLALVYFSTVYNLPSKIDVELQANILHTILEKNNRSDALDVIIVSHETPSDDQISTLKIENKMKVKYINNQFNITVGTASIGEIINMAYYDWIKELWIDKNVYETPEKNIRTSELIETLLKENPQNQSTNSNIKFYTGLVIACVTAIILANKLFKS